MSNAGKDMIIVGAGSAGAGLAAFAAEAGMRVLCVDRRALDDTGARWVNDAPNWMLREVGVELPADATFGHHAKFHMIAGWSSIRVSAAAGDTSGIHMPRLVASLQARAVRAGAELRGNANVEFDRGSGRLHIDGDEVDAPTIVDASGLAGISALGQMHTHPEDICAAAQEVREIADLDEAHRFFERAGMGTNDIAVFTGVAGGYSIVNIRLVDGRVGILTGSIPADGHPSGKQLLDTFVREHRWVGDRVFGGARAIPLTHARGRLVRGHFVAIGDAASQVFSSHGSGTGAGLIAARMLVDALKSGAGPHGYARAWQRRFGLFYALQDLFRRFTQSLSLAELTALIENGFPDAPALEAALHQRLAPAHPRQVLSLGRAFAKHPTLATRLAGFVARGAAAAVHFATHPDEGEQLGDWEERLASIVRGARDVGTGLTRRGGREHR
jgi:flavin-dependent dehydrogenase